MVRKRRRHSEGAQTFDVGLTTVNRYDRSRWDSGPLDRKPHPGRTPTIRPDQQDALAAHVVEHPTAILASTALWEQSHGVQMSLVTICRAIRKVGYTRKKGHWVPSNATKYSVGRRTGSRGPLISRSWSSLMSPAPPLLSFSVTDGHPAASAVSAQCRATKGRISSSLPHSCSTVPLRCGLPGLCRAGPLSLSHAWASRHPG